MQCKNHPDRQATQFCVACGMPLCNDCAEESESGQYYCFRCAMKASISAGSETIRDKKEKAADGRAKEKKRLTAFHYFVIFTSTLILAMWGYILLGGQEYTEFEENINLAGNTRVLLFMVDGGIKSYAHANGNRYPETLDDLVPDYVSIDLEGFLEEHPNMLSYERNPEKGYSLVLKESKEMHIVISADGIRYIDSSNKGA